MRILYDSKDLKFKNPFGCVKVNQNIEINIHIPKSVETLDASVVLKNDDGVYKEFTLIKSSEYDLYEIYNGNISIDKAGLYFYYFKINARYSAFSLYKQGYSDTNMEAGELWQLTCIPFDYKTPDCFKGKVMYQIFPDRFFADGQCDLTDKIKPFWVHNDVNDVPHFLPDHKGEILNNDFFGGNLLGIMQKLSYISELGVEIIYLNPIFKAFSNHRYDIADYKTIDPMLGTYDDFVALCEQAKKHNIKIILDGVFSHTGIHSIYFQGAISDWNSPYREWYKFNNYPNEYESWWGIKTLPNVEEMTPSYLDYIIRDDDSVIAYWLNAGASGFLLDVADELPDEFIKLLRNRVKEINPDAIVIGEVWEDASNKESYGKRREYFTGCELDSVMNYPFNNAILDFLNYRINAFEFSNTIMTILENYPKESVDCLMNSLSTHDTVRVITLLGGQLLEGDKGSKAYNFLQGDALNSAISKVKLAAFMQFALPGNPCIYYGDEVGLQGFEDPLNRRFFPWDNINEELHSHYISLGKLKKVFGIKNAVVYAYNNDTIVIEREDTKAIICRNSDTNADGEIIFKTYGCIVVKK